MPLTGERPKALIEVGGRSLAERAKESLEAAGVSEVVAVVGHCAESMEGMGLELRFNQRFADADNIYSLWLTRDVVSRGCLIVNSDVIFDIQIAQALVGQSGTAILCDDTHSRDGEAMKAVTRNGRLTRLSKDAPLDDNQGEYIGLARIDPADGARLARILDEFVEREDVQVYYEDAIEQLAREVSVSVVSVAGCAWAEVDDFDDLAFAEKEIASRVDGAGSKT